MQLPPETVQALRICFGTLQANNHLREYVDVAAWEGACLSVMMKLGFTAPKLLEHTYLRAWTLIMRVISGEQLHEPRPLLPTSQQRP
jgi:hypothetical protein